MIYLPRIMYLSNSIWGVGKFLRQWSLKVDKCGMLLKVISGLWLLTDCLLSVHRDANSLL